MTTYISLGTVARPFGLRGEIKVKPHNPLTTWFDRAPAIWLRTRPEDEPARWEVLRAHWHKDFIVLALAGVRDRTGAEALQGMEVVTPECELEPLVENEFYWYQLLGLRVETVGGERLGEVVRIETTAPELDGNDVLVALGDRGEVQIPATTEAVVEVDLEAGRIVVRAEALE